MVHFLEILEEMNETRDNCFDIKIENCAGWHGVMRIPDDIIVSENTKLKKIYIIFLS